ncbi:amidohydrolase family protein [Pseudemcibacter aquimaris]|uniref:amidohydrolase family protein n=1 Tax=Pseudemcibacter aquimaris TaxID=2857064 RepID=UPI002012E4CF|nr:amidohydrolase family protein [Pseudemcibacter aquimaris]MCC3862393.1 amidohydrolase family protein [Pseudemcibacter aquimaris]WDU59177.1 amidohydrolase family protein [Pseudemcibacter aquimaris]
MTIDVIIKGGTVVSHMGIERKDIAIRDGIIVAMGDLSGINSKAVHDAGGLHILPGVIDTDLSMGETPENECRAAIRGGVTSALIHGGTDGLSIDHAKYINVTTDNVDAAIDMELDDGIAGLSVSMVDGLSDDKSLHELLSNAKRRVTIHAEDHDELEKSKSKIKPGEIASHNDWHNEKVQTEATRRILAIARGAGQPVHLTHVGSDKALGMIAAYKELATCSLSPHHMFLSTPHAYNHFQEYALIDPPVGSDEIREGLWKGLMGGIVDMVCSYHQPIGINDKEPNYPNCKSGAPSVQTMLPLLLDLVNNDRLSLQTVIDLTSTGPARAFNIVKKGRVAVGYDADFTIIDLNKKWMLDDDDVESGCGWDHYAGCEFHGAVTGTMIRGELALWNGELTGSTKGETLKFTDTFQEYEKL